MTAVTGPPRCTITAPGAQRPISSGGTNVADRHRHCTSRRSSRVLAIVGRRRRWSAAPSPPRRRGGRGEQPPEEWWRPQLRPRGRDDRLLPEPGPAGDLGHPGRRGDLRHAHRAQQQGRPVPYLAKSVTPNADSTQWTIGLRPGIKFQDGSPRRGRGEAEPRRVPGAARWRRTSGAAVHDLPRVHPAT